MPPLNIPTIQSEDLWVEHPRGKIYARAWSRAGESPESSPLAPIVLFHDSLGSVDLWRGFPVDLAAATGRKVIAYDRLGFGKSDPREDKLKLDFVADEARTYFPMIRQQLGVQRFIAFGHSVGGAMAVHCAAGFAADCEKLITESAQVFPEDRTLQGIRAAKLQFQDESQFERLRKYHGDKARWVLDAWTGTWLSPEFASWSVVDVLPQVTCPVLAIHGVDDEYGTTRHANMIGTLCSGQSRVELLADTDHVPHRERPELVVKLVTDFITSAG